MATASQLEQAGLIHKYDPALDDDEQELRILWTSARLKAWVEDELPGLSSQWGVETPPNEQFDAFLETYASGLPLVFGNQFKPFQPRAIQPMGDGVWYLKTPDLRLFGWFWKQDCFIGVVAETAERCKKYDLYQGYRGDVTRFRDAIDLDEPKYIAGTDPHAVISNFDYPD